MNKDAKKVFSRIGLALAVITITIYVIQILLTYLIQKKLPSLASSGWMSYLLLLVFYFIGVPLFYLFVRKLPTEKKQTSKKLSIKEILILFLISYALMFITNLFTLILIHLTTLIKGNSITNPLQNLLSTSDILATFIFAGILSPIVEEILFRGLILNRLKCYGDKIAIITTAVLFGLFHGNFSQFFYATILGLIFAYVTLKTGTIKYSIILHIMINMMGSVLSTFLSPSNITLSFILSLVILSFIVLGIIFLIKNRKKVYLSSGTIEIEKGQVFKTTCLNVGMIINFIINFALMLFILLS